MDNQLKQQFTLRITQAGKTELCVILYEMFIVYCKDAIHCIEEDDVKSFRVNIQRARGCLKELMDSLHFEYEPAPILLKLYIYISKLLVSADLHNTTAPLEEAVHIMQSLHDSFETISKQDTSGPVMGNTQTVYAGLTYGKTDLNVSLSDPDNRGFFA